ncbi:hypothetical protein ACHAXR_011032 [Thalassiosira sp. AJA248-18]
MRGIDEGNAVMNIFWGSAASFIDQMRLGASSLLSSFHPSTSSSAKVTNMTIPSQRIEEDYVFLFYLLLWINFLAMLPRWYKYLRSKQTHLTNMTHQQDQLMKNDGQAIIHNKLLHTYLPAYLLATCADWLQGPYKYALYSSYGYTQRDIAHLFVAGYGSGMVLGSIVGGLADSYGRKRLCLCYCLSYTFSVLMKHCKHFYVLLLGRVGGGVATSLLFSVFESWLIRAHGVRGLGSKGGLTKEEEEKWLAKSLAVSMYGSSLVAIGSGVLANLVVGISGKMRPWNVTGNGEPLLYIGGYIAAFDVCLVPLALCAVLIMVLWEENYGEASASTNDEVSSNGLVAENGHHSAGFLKKHSSIQVEDEGSTEEDKNRILSEEEHRFLLAEEERASRQKERWCSALFSGIHTVWNTPNILVCCVIGSIFEGAMYIFIFLWTPALTSLQEQIGYRQGDIEETEITESTEKDIHTDSELPFGWIFSTFMVCCMLGTITFSRLSNAGIPASKCLAGILALASLSCIAMACPSSSGLSSGASSSANTPQYLGMMVYEFCIGFYYPAMGTVKGTIVPEDQRAAIYNVFRLPLNLLVLVYLVGDFSTQKSFLANAALLMLACTLQIHTVRGGIVSKSHHHSSGKDLD